MIINIIRKLFAPVPVPVAELCCCGAGAVEVVELLESVGGGVEGEEDVDVDDDDVAETSGKAELEMPCKPLTLGSFSRLNLSSSS
jgi:hypothetical protein